MGGIPCLRRALRHRLAWPLVAALLACEYAGWVGYQAVRNRLYDFNLYYVAARAWREGIDVYALAEKDGKPLWEALAARYGVMHLAPPYRYPPLTAELVLPLTAFPPLAAGIVWLILSAGTFIAAAWLLGRTSNQEGGPALAGLLLAGWVPALATLHAGQVNGFLLLALCAGLYGLWRGREALAGAGLAIGVMLKLVPVALVGYLAWRGRWRALAAAVGVILVLWASAAIPFGETGLASYFAHLPALGEMGRVIRAAPNQSLNGLWGRLLADWVSDEAIYRIYLFSLGALGLVMIGLLWPPGLRGASITRREVALSVCALQLATPYAWYHQMVILIMPAFVLADEILSGQAPKWWLGPLGVAFFLFDLHGLAWHAAPASWRVGLSFPCLTALLMLGMLGWLVKKGEAPAGSMEC